MRLYRNNITYGVIQYYQLIPMVVNGSLVTLSIRNIQYPLVEYSRALVSYTLGTQLLEKT